MNSLEQPTYVPGTYRGADAERTPGNTEQGENAENEPHIESIMNSLRSPEFEARGINDAVLNGEYSVSAIVNVDTGEISTFPDSEDKDTTIDTDSTEITLLCSVGKLGPNPGDAREVPPHVKGFRVSEEGISITAFDNLKEAIERLKIEKGATPPTS